MQPWGSLAFSGQRVGGASRRLVGQSRPRRAPWRGSAEVSWKQLGLFLPIKMTARVAGYATPGECYLEARW